MIDDQKIARINELAKKKKTEGLTDNEKKEQKKLRDIYIKSVRENLRSQLSNITFVDAEEPLTDEQKKHVEALSDKLGKEYREVHEKGN